MDNKSVDVTIGSPGVYYEVQDGFSDGGCASDAFTFTDNYRLLCSRAGKYKVDWSMTMNTRTYPVHLRGVVMVNAYEQINTSSMWYAVNDRDYVHISGTGIITLNDGDYVSLGVANEDWTDNVNIAYSNLTLIQVAGQ